jgi:dihydroneopterin aldolase/2-amino-4-hydroxy-6-hydroxymethyldihydropteridine diphosphokinase
VTGGWPPGDRIEVRGLELLALCGVLPEEQARRQPFRFDLDIYVDLVPAGASDALDDTVDYGRVADQLAERIGSERYQLLERMAQRAADVVLAWPQVEAVTVTATKLRPPVPLPVATTGVRVHRARQVGAGGAGPAGDG